MIVFIIKENGEVTVKERNFPELQAFPPLTPRTEGHLPPRTEGHCFCLKKGQRRGWERSGERSFHSEKARQVSNIFNANRPTLRSIIMEFPEGKRVSYKGFQDRMAETSQEQLWKAEASTF